MIHSVLFINSSETLKVAYKDILPIIVEEKIPGHTIVARAVSIVDEAINMLQIGVQPEVIHIWIDFNHNWPADLARLADQSKNTPIIVLGDIGRILKELSTEHPYLPKNMLFAPIEKLANMRDLLRPFNVIFRNG